MLSPDQDDRLRQYLEAIERLKQGKHSIDLPIGFIFFSSVQPHTYADVHVDIFMRIAEQLAVIVEKGRLTSELTAQKAAIGKQNQELLGSISSWTICSRTRSSTRRRAARCACAHRGWNQAGR